MEKNLALECTKQTDKRQRMWLSLKADIESSLGVIRAIDTGKAKGYNRPLFVGSIINKVETLANKGDVEMVRKAVGLVTEYNNISEKPAVTGRNRLFRMEEKAISVRSRIESDYGNRNKKIHFDGGKLILNRETDRLQIVYDQIPDDETRKRLKSSGFRWSPTNRAWQRHLTQNSIRAAERLLGIDTELAEGQVEHS